MSTQFEKGNPGKPKGAKNKVTTEIREKFDQLLQSVTAEQMAADLLALKPAERLNLIMGLAEYITPKLARTQMQFDNQAILNPVFKINVIHSKDGFTAPPLANSEKDVVL
ncbi:hypothetical protein I5M27_12890 [Adhaeribacter sp. BT258]|uniref:Uncharacterized protein n=1 Tax=Adhaeribacter terrigena TaxID=2793070 RepID=A0ABS1C3A3_9BACT|nr:hypothetical protein [Adhaeribacter terrigena]MBK0403884.1 hypothetical protein [Adhaeribacter terrigena]